MATRSEVHFPPPPKPRERWRDFMSQLEKHAALNNQATPAVFLQQVGGTPDHPLSPLKHLRDLLGSDKQAFLPNGLFLGVVTRKFHVRFWDKGSSSGCSFCIWVKDSTDLVRVTFWDAAVHSHYERLQEGMLVSVRGFKLKPLFRHERDLEFDVEKLSPAEVIICANIPGRGIKVSQVLTIDTHLLWHYAGTQDQSTLRSFMAAFLNFEFGPEKLKVLADTPLSMDCRRSIIGRIVYKSNIRTTKTNLGDVPCLWVALCDGSLDGTEKGSGQREYIWVFLVFNFQPDLFEELSLNQLIVVTYVTSLYLFHEEWKEFFEWKLVCHSSTSTQVHIVTEEADARVWHYIRSVNEQKHELVRSHVKSMVRLFGDVPPETSLTPENETLFRQGRFECAYKYC